MNKNKNEKVGLKKVNFEKKIREIQAVQNRDRREVMEKLVKI